MVLKFKKGFSLVELLVVIAIIGILAAVGITAYSGYTASAKEKSALANHAQIVKFINAEFAKCAGGSGNYIWDVGDNRDNCVMSTDTGTVDTVTYEEGVVNAALIKKHINEVLKVKNPYDVNTMSGAVGGTAKGTNKIACTGDGCIVTTYHGDINTPSGNIPYM